MPKRKFRPATLKVTVTNPSLSQAPPKPNNEVPPTVRQALAKCQATCLMIDNGFSQKAI